MPFCSSPREYHWLLRESRQNNRYFPNSLLYSWPDHRSLFFCPFPRKLYDFLYRIATSFSSIASSYKSLSTPRIWQSFCFRLQAVTRHRESGLQAGWLICYSNEWSKALIEISKLCIDLNLAPSSSFWIWSAQYRSYWSRSWWDTHSNPT